MKRLLALLPLVLLVLAAGPSLADERIQGLIEGKTVRKVIVVPGKMVNIVAN